MRKKLKIAQIAPLWIPVPPKTYGGTELMLSNLVEELVTRGHDVTLFASGDSGTRARLVAPTATSLWRQRDLKNPHAVIVKMLRMVKEEIENFDLLHSHFNFFAFPLALCDNLPPMLTTIHRPVDGTYADVIKLFPQIKFCAISENAKQQAEAQGVEIAGVVPNGIDVPRYEWNGKPEDYLLYLGRLNREKGILPALRVARQAGKKLVVAGNMVGAEEWNFFMQEVQPFLNEEGVNFVGAVDFSEKVRLFKNASALLFPIDREEPFGLVMIEAMACGTPVIAYRRGSVPEVVVDGKTGFIADTGEEMIAAVGRVKEIDRRACRKHVELNFTIAQMVDKYEALYERLLGK